MIPVPMLTANQEGVKLRIRRRHSREMGEVGEMYAGGGGCVGGDAFEGGAFEGDVVGADAVEADAVRVGADEEKEVGPDPATGEVDKLFVDILTRIRRLISLSTSIGF